MAVPVRAWTDCPDRRSSLFRCAAPCAPRPAADTEANDKGCVLGGDDYYADDDVVQAGARVTWLPTMGVEHYVQVTGDAVDEYGSFTMTLSSLSSFSVEKVQGE